MIELKNLSKIYEVNGTSISAVEHVDLTIDTGEIFGVIGYSGAGKSTLVRLINALIEPTTGEVVVNGVDITEASPRQLRQARQKMGMVFQHFDLLWSRTVAENIEFPLEIAHVDKQKRRKKVENLLELVGLSDRAHAYPAELSGGQKQRVGIARALANDPHVLLCDEATSALDSETTQEILELLVDINQKLNLTIIMISHELPIIRQICDRVAVMSNGQIVEVNDNPEIFINPKSSVTRRLIQKDSGFDGSEIEKTIKELSAQYPGENIYELRFTRESAKKPIVTQVSLEYQVKVNIIQGSLQSVRGQSIGSLYVQIIGESANIAEAIQAFRDEGIVVEVIYYED